jgi:hypothetical protein
LQREDILPQACAAELSDFDVFQAVACGSSSAGIQIGSDRMLPFSKGILYGNCLSPGTI